MNDPKTRPPTGPEITAERVALWRAMHVQIDPPPYIFEDEIGLRLLSPSGDWRARPDMHPQRTSRNRASIVARARFIEDMVMERAALSVGQYVILGAGLDTFVQRRPDSAANWRVFEVDRPASQEWKRQRLIEFGYGIPKWLNFVPVDFEAGIPWWDALSAAGFEESKPAIVVSAGVAMYLTRDVTLATLRRCAAFASGSALVMTYILPLDLIEPEERPGRQAIEKFAAMAGTPFIGFYSPEEILSLAREAGFRVADRVSAADLTRKYFAGRSDGLRPSSSEELIVATV